MRGLLLAALLLWDGGLASVRGAGSAQVGSAVRRADIAARATVAEELIRNGQYRAAIDEVKQIRELEREEYGEDHSLLAGTASKLAGLYEQVGDYPNAILEREESLRIEQLHQTEGAWQIKARLAALQKSRRLAQLGAADRSRLVAAERTMRRAAATLGSDLTGATLDQVRGAVTVFREVLGERSGSYFDAVTALAIQLHVRRQFDEALVELGNILPEYGDTFGRDCPRFQSSADLYLRMLGEQAARREKDGDFAGATESLLEVQRTCEATFGDEHWRVTDARLDLESSQAVAALSDADRRRYRTAHDQLSTAVSLAKAPASRSAERGASLAAAAYRVADELVGKSSAIGLGGRYWEALHLQTLGREQEALQRLSEVVELAESRLGGKHPDYASYLSALATAHQRLGNGDEARSGFERAIEVARNATGEDSSEYAVALCNLGSFCLAQRAFDRAGPLLLEAVEIYDQSGRDDLDGYAGAVYNLGVFYLFTLDLSQALDTLQRATRIAEQTLPADDPTLGSIYNALGEAHEALGDSAEAARCFDKSWRIRQQLPPNHPERISADNTRASHLALQGKFEEALEILERVAQQSGQLKDPQFAGFTINYGIVLLQVGRRRDAEQTLRAVIDELRNVLTSIDPRQITAKVALAAAVDDPAEALKLWQEVTETVCDLEESVAAVQSERQQVMTSRLRYRVLSQFLSAALSNVGPDGLDAETLYSVVFSMKGAVFRRQWKARRSDSEDVRRIRRDLREVSAARSDIRLAFLPVEQRRSKYLKLVRADEELRQQLAVHGAEERVASLAELRQTLPASTLLLDFVEYEYYADSTQMLITGPAERRVLAFVVRRDRPIRCLQLGAADSIEKVLAEWEEAISRSSAEPAGRQVPDPDRLDELGRVLSKKCWSDLIAGEDLRGIRLLLVSPDGVMGRVPWLALPAISPGKRYLVEENIAVALTPSAQQLVANRNASGSPSIEHLLLMDQLRFGAADEQARWRRGHLPKTLLSEGEGGPFLDLELDEHAKRLQSSMAQLGTAPIHRTENAATETAFRELAPNADMVHVVTHGFFERPRGPLGESRASWLWSDASLGPWGHHPGLSCGIVFSGINDFGPWRTSLPRSSDDGRLSAFEAAEMELDRVQCLVLHACRSGVGPIGDADISYSLVRSFHLSGCQMVVASLWDVDRGATNALFHRFYERLARGDLTAVQALHAAQKDLCLHGEGESQLHPFYFASFYPSVLGVVEIPDREPATNSLLAQLEQPPAQGAVGAYGPKQQVRSARWWALIAAVVLLIVAASCAMNLPARQLRSS